VLSTDDDARKPKWGQVPEVGDERRKYSDRRVLAQSCSYLLHTPAGTTGPMAASDRPRVRAISQPRAATRGETPAEKKPVKHSTGMATVYML
jgi:hypothetical protein